MLITNIIKNKLTNEQIDFIEQLQEYCDAEFRFYGSIERKDYFEGSSDIDIDVFTSNLHSTVFKIRQFLSTPNDNVQNILWSTTKPTFSKFKCKKIKFKNNFIKLELGIYDIKYKIKLINVREYKRNIPYHGLVILFIIKLMFYKFNIISTSQLASCKKYLMGNILGMADDYNVIKKV
jgi:hypothetical protein